MAIFVLIFSRVVLAVLRSVFSTVKPVACWQSECQTRRIQSFFLEKRRALFLARSAEQQDSGRQGLCGFAPRMLQIFSRGGCAGHSWGGAVARGEVLVENSSHLTQLIFFPFSSLQVAVSNLKYS